MTTETRLTQLNSITRDHSTPNQRPRDAASIVILDNSGEKVRMLVGKRHPDQTFIPNKFVFPGGRVDPADTRVNAADELSIEEEAKLLAGMKGRILPSRARGLALAAVRELYEETGLLIGTPHNGSVTSRSPSWSGFISSGYAPRIGKLRFFARAITPPRRPRRYDTRFFVTTADQIAGNTQMSDGELTELRWATFDEARSYDLHVMTRTIVDELEDLLDARSRLKRRQTVPFYYTERGAFRRRLLKPDRCG